jgi:hypothetical protein
MIRRLFERVTPSGRRERRELQARVDRILSAADRAERRRRAQRIYETYVSH